MRRTVRTALVLLTVLAALHFAYAAEMRGVPVDIGQCSATVPPA
jgi:hypothetical protein